MTVSSQMGMVWLTVKGAKGDRRTSLHWVPFVARQQAVAGP